MKNRPVYILFMLALIFHLIHVTYFAHNSNIWIDEAYTLNTISKDVKFAFVQAIEFEQQAPIYFLIIFVWSKISSSIFFLRVFSIIVILLSAFFLYKICLFLYSGNTKLTLITLTVFLLHPLVLAQAINIRRYSLVILISLILLYLYLLSFLKVKTKNHLILFSVVSLIGVLTDYFIAFFLLSLIIPFVIFQQWREVKKYMLCMLPSLVTVFILIPVIYLQTVSHKSHVESLTLFPEFFNNLKSYVISTIEGYILGIGYYKNPHFSKLQRFSVIIVFFILGFRIYRSSQKKPIEYLFITTVILYILFFILSLSMGKALVTLHHKIVILAPILILFMYQVNVLKLKIIGGLFIALILINFLIADSKGLNSNERRMMLSRHYQDKYSKVSSYIMSKETLNQPVLVFPNEEEIILKHYYKGKNNLKALPHSINFSKPYNHKYWILNSKKQLIDIFTDLNNCYSEFWLITPDVSEIVYYDIAYNKVYLDEFIKNNYKELHVKKIHGLKVTLLKK